MKAKKSWMVNCVKHSPICGLKCSVVGIYDSKAAARTAVRLHIETWRKAHCHEGVEVDFDKMAAWYDYDKYDGSRWFIKRGGKHPIEWQSSSVIASFK